MNFFYDLPDELQKYIVEIRSAVLIQNYWRRCWEILIERRIDEAYERWRDEDSLWYFNSKYDLP